MVKIVSQMWREVFFQSAEAPSDKYQKAAMLADALQKGEKEEPGIHYRVDEKQKSVLMTDEGYEEAEEALGVRAIL